MVRVSTSRQETDRQIQDLRKIIASKGWHEVALIEEDAVRGSAKIRKGIDAVIALAEAGSIDKVAVHEVSRIARKNSVAHLLLEKLTECQVSLYWHSQGLETLLDNGSRNPAASLVFSIMAEFARSESEQLSYRIKSGLDEARRKGKTLGREPKHVDDFLKENQCVVDALKAGMSIRATATHCNRAIMTVQKVKKAISHV